MPRTRTPVRTAAPLLWAVALAASGCTEPRNPGGKQAVQPAPEPESTFIVGQRTQDVRRVEDETPKGAEVVPPRVVARDPITLSGNAYVTAIDQTSILSIQQALDLYHATNDRYPKDYNEFMVEIIQANNIALPKLPHYQEYGYDEAQHKLVILEFPDRKANPPQFR